MHARSNVSLYSRLGSAAGLCLPGPKTRPHRRSILPEIHTLLGNNKGKGSAAPRGRRDASRVEVPSSDDASSEPQAPKRYEINWEYYNYFYYNYFVDFIAVLGWCLFIIINIIIIISFKFLQIQFLQYMCYKTP